MQVILGNIDANSQRMFNAPSNNANQVRTFVGGSILADWPHIAS
jgi:hypothetical protein